MLQLVITFVIVLAATGIAVYRIFRYLRDPLIKCDGCEKHCGDCPVDELKKRLDEKKKSGISQGSRG